MADTLKIVCIGPCQSGKTHLCNYLYNPNTLEKPVNYIPTVGTRILEFERGATDVELWDCSGDKKYENCWPAIAKDAHGIILVVDSNSKGLDKDLRPYYSGLQKLSGLMDKHCLSVMYLPEKESRKQNVVLGTVKFTTFAPWDADKFNREFTDFMETILVYKNQRESSK